MENNSELTTNELRKVVANLKQAQADIKKATDLISETLRALDGDSMDKVLEECPELNPCLSDADKAEMRMEERNEMVERLLEGIDGLDS
jgi:hypothetical protein